MAGLGSELVALLSRRGGGRRGNGRAEELVSWANRAIEAGIGGQAIGVLAGETEPLYSSEVDALLACVLDQLGLPEPAGPDELLDAEVHVICDDLEIETIDSDVALSSVSKIVIGARPDRFGDWLDLIEGVAMIEYGDQAAFVPGLNRENIERHVLRTARATLRTLPRPDWLPAYLVLDSWR